jgi:hypothetical protein
MYASHGFYGLSVVFRPAGPKNNRLQCKVPSPIEMVLLPESALQKGILMLESTWLGALL